MSAQNEKMQQELDRIFAAFPHIRTIDIPGIDLYMDQVTTFLQESLSGLSRDPEDDKFLTKTMINNYVKNKVLIPPVKKKYSRDHMMLLIMIYYMKSFLSIGDISSITGPLMEVCSSVSDLSERERSRREKEAVDRKRELAEKRKDSAAGKREADRKRESLDKNRDHADKNRDHADKNRDHPDKNRDTAEKTQARPEILLRDVYETVIADIDQELPRIHEDILRQINLAEQDFADVPEEERPVLQRFSLICRLSAEVYLRKLFIEKLLDAEKP